MAAQVPSELQGKATTTVEITAKVLGIGLNQAYAAVKSGEIVSLRIGNRIVVPVAPLLRMLGIEEEPSVVRAQTAA